jgi:hypothetical protein
VPAGLRLIWAMPTDPGHALLRVIGAAHLFLVALDDEQTSFRYHHLVRRLLRAELHARDQGREQKLQLQAAEWFQAAGDSRRAARHFLAARQADRALTLLEDRAVPDFLADPLTRPSFACSSCCRPAPTCRWHKSSTSPATREDPPAVDLPKARGGVSLAGHRARSRTAPPLKP